MHSFYGKWITNEEFAQLKPRNVFFRQLERIELDCSVHRNRHILFRKKFTLQEIPENARIYISADDYYKLSINGKFAGQGPAPSYHHMYCYNVIDVTSFLNKGENTIAVHTLYQGLINRVWQSGDNRHGMILDLVADGKVLIASDETFKTHVHTGYRETSTVGYMTQFMEEYNSSAPEVGFQSPSYDDSYWENAQVNQYAGYTLSEQKSAMLEFEKIIPVKSEKCGNILRIDFGSNYVGYLCAEMCSKNGGVVVIRCGQELNDDGSVRYRLRANCEYEESWILKSGKSVLDQFDYKSFRYCEIELPEGAVCEDVYLSARHYPFTLNAQMKEEYKGDKSLEKIWNLCVNTQKYGVQEVIQDCMEREKGFYVGDGCYTALTHMILTKDDSMVRKLIDDGFASSFITEGLVTCLNCSLMQEIAEYPLILIYLVYWHYNITGDESYLSVNYPKVVSVLECYRRDYEADGLLCNLDKWCVVEWPENFQDGYDVDIREGIVCKEAHVSINAYYIEAVRTANKIASVLKLEKYRDETVLKDAFVNAFYDKSRSLFRDGIHTDHISIVGNVFPFAFRLCPDDECRENIISLIKERKISSVSFFCTFLVLIGFVRSGMEDEIKNLMLDDGAWLRMLSEDATTTFEGWGKDTKWNTSLFHLTMSYGALFLSDSNLKEIFE